MSTAGIAFRVAVPPTGDDAFLHSGLGRVEGVLDAELLVLHLDLSGSADLDHGDDASQQLSQAFLQFFTVEVGGGGGDLAADLGNTVGDGLLVAVTCRRWWSDPW